MFTTRYTYRAAALAAGVVFGGTACSMSDLVEVELPAATTNPEAVNTPQGALDRYNAVIMQFRTGTTSGNGTTGGFYNLSALFSDELGAGMYNTPTSGVFSTKSAIDSRSPGQSESGGVAESTVAGLWQALARVRVTAQDAIYALRAFNPNAPKDLTGHAHTLGGISEVMLAELYCSGIPLTNLANDGSGKFTYGAALTQAQVYEHAVAQFDTALSLIRDSVTFQNLAKVGRARALLNLGRFADAAQAVSGVPTSFKYQNLHSLTPAGAVGVSNFTVTRGVQYGYGTMVDREGGVGLDYVSANDPRVTWKDSTDAGYPLTTVVLPDKWNAPDRGGTAVTVADGIEARLIEAEAALRAGGGTGWLTTLNTLRTNGTQTGGVWNAGTGGVAGLAPLTDPGTAAARVDLVFRERAFWLYLTGHRIGDMRRLVRQYGRTVDSVFPNGSYPAGPLGNYGRDVNFPAPASEVANNPKYSGCIDREA